MQFHSFWWLLSRKACQSRASNFLSSGQAFFPIWSFSGVFFLRSGRKAKLPICRECHLRENISVCELIQAKIHDVTWKRDVPWMFALSNSGVPWAALPGSLVQDHWSQKLVQHLWVLSFFFPAIGQRKILQMDCLDCSAGTRKSCCWISLTVLKQELKKLLLGNLFYWLISFALKSLQHF